MAKQCLVCGKNTGIKEKDNFCPNCGAKLPETVKPATYVTERVVNIGDLEKYIEQAHLSTVSIIHGIRAGEIPGVLEIADCLEKMDKFLEKACNFEFCVERRTTISH